MPVVKYTGGLPASIAENSGPADWIANLTLSGDLPHLVSVVATGPMAAYFSVAWNAAHGLATIRPDARLDFEAFSAAGTLPQVEFGLAFVFDDGSRQADAAPLRLAVLDRDDTAPTALAFGTGGTGGTVAAGAIGATIGTLSVTDPDSSGRFFFSFTSDDDWRFEVVNGVLKLRDGITLGWDDVPHRPVLIEVSDGRQSAAFQLDLSVAPPADGPSPYTPPVLAPGETHGGFALAGPHEALTARPSAAAVAINAQPGDTQQVFLGAEGSVWLGPEVDRIRFADGVLDLDPHGTAAQAAALHHAVSGGDADGAGLAPLVASLQAGVGWAAVAGGLLAATPTLAALDDAHFVGAIATAALGPSPDAALLAAYAGRLAAGAESRAQVAVDIALSPASLARTAAAAPSGHWVADPFDDAAHLPLHPAIAEAAPAAAAAAVGAWFM